MTSKRRLAHLLAWAVLILVIGSAYAIFVWTTGLSVPCPFHAVTGLWCPGCGVTRMCLALLRLDLAAAWRANPGLLLLLPFLAILLGSMGWDYVRRGKRPPRSWQSVLVWCMVGFMLLYGAARNLPVLAFLAPGA